MTKDLKIFKMADALIGMIEQHCSFDIEGKFHDNCLSANEYAIRICIDYGLVTKVSDTPERYIVNYEILEKLKEKESLDERIKEIEDVANINLDNEQHLDEGSYNELCGKKEMAEQSLSIIKQLQRN